MMLDSSLEICDNISAAAAAGTATIGTAKSMGLGNTDPNSGDNLALVINVSEAFTSGGAATVQFRVVSDAQAPVTTNGTETQHAETQAFAYTELTLGKFIIIPLPRGIRAYEEFLGLIVVTATATTTAGKVNAFLVKDWHTWKAYADGVN